MKRHPTLSVENRQFAFKVNINSSFSCQITGDDVGADQRKHRALYDSRDYQEGIRALKEKRPPVFTGE